MILLSVFVQVANWDSSLANAPELAFEIGKVPRKYPIAYECLGPVSYDHKSTLELERVDPTQYLFI